MGGSVSVYRGYGNYIFNLEENLQTLERTIPLVVGMRDDVVRRIAEEEMKGQKRTLEVQVWLRDVETVIQKALGILQYAQVERNRLCLLGYCSTNLISSYKYGKTVHHVLKQVECLISKSYGVVAYKPIYAMEFSAPVLVGQERRLENIRQLVKENGVGIIGIYGMGGVGKTALVSQLYQRISTEEVSHFDSLIWISVSPRVQIHRIQDDIGKKIALYNEEWVQKSESEKAVSIHTSLRRYRFLMVLDDLWEKLDLAKIGIPLPTSENGCKIIITSRSRDVCEAMLVDASLEIRPLDKHEAWQLFQNQVGETILESHPEIHRLATQIADKCCGLPIVLQVVGASMASQTSVHAWRHALNQFTNPISNLEDILLILKMSYDALEGKQVKLCFLSFILFPEDEEVSKEDLVELWIGEEIIDYRDKDRGYEIIRVLLDTSFLMEVGESKDKVSMHDIIRELALHIATRTEEDDKEDFIGFTQVGRLSDIKKWRDVCRVSLVGDDIKTLSGDFYCPKLKTLFLRDIKLETISPEFFYGMPLLLVLDLSSNQHLNALPDTISELVSLRYLNLSSTGIKRLPFGLFKLKKLAYLYLEHTHMLKNITGISHIVNIQVLRLRDSGFHASHRLVEELQLLERLELLTITLQDEDVVKHFLTSPKLAKCTQGFYLNYCAILSSISFTSLSSSLRCLDVQDSYIPEVMIDRSATGGEAIIALDAIPSDALFTNLNEVRLDGCNGLRELTWLLLAPNLTKLRVAQSRDIEEIISQKKAANLDIVPFQKLEFLALEGLERLRSIYWRPLPLPELREIRIRSCPGLTKLPLNSESAKGRNLVLSAEKEMMQRIEWEDRETKQRLFPS